MTDYDYLCIVCGTIVASIYGAALLHQKGKADFGRLATLVPVCAAFSTLGVIVGKFVCVNLMQ